MHLEQSLKKNAEWMLALNAITHEIARKSTLEDILGVAVQYLEGSFNLAYAAVLVRSEESNSFNVGRVDSRGQVLASSCGTGGCIESWNCPTPS